MRLRKFLGVLDEALIADAIHFAELGTTGKVRVFVSGRRLRKDDIMRRAAARFEKLGMTNSTERHGILLYFVPLDCRFAIFGDRGIHERCGDVYWKQLSTRIGECLQREEFTEAVVHAVREIGKLLGLHFPR